MLPSLPMARTSCPRPSYTRVLVSDLGAGLVTLASVAVGATGGYYIHRAMDGGGGAGMFIGGTVGFLGGIYPSMLAQRALIRSKPDCPNPSMMKVLGYRLVQGAVAVPLVFGMRASMPDKCANGGNGTLVGLGQSCKPNRVRQGLSTSVMTLGFPLLGMMMLKENGRRKRN